jgi:hypothetical protein
MSNNPNAGARDPQGPPHVQFRVQTPRGVWSMSDPAGATIRPDYPISTKIGQVIADARSVFGFVENDSKYTVLLGTEQLDPERTIASYKVETNTLLVLTVQGGNA